MEEVGRGMEMREEGEGGGEEDGREERKETEIERETVRYIGKTGGVTKNIFINNLSM